MVSSPRPPRPGPASTTTSAPKPSARCASALGWVVAMNVLLAATQIAVGSAVKSLAFVADGVEGGTRILLDNSRVYVRFYSFVSGRFHLGRISGY